MVTVSTAVTVSFSLVVFVFSDGDGEIGDGTAGVAPPHRGAEFVVGVSRQGGRVGGEDAYSHDFCHGLGETRLAVAFDSA